MEFEIRFQLCDSLSEAYAVVFQCAEKMRHPENVQNLLVKNADRCPSITHPSAANSKEDDVNWVNSLFTLRFTYWPEYKLLGLLGDGLNLLGDAKPLFYSKAIEDYQLDAWEGIAPFFDKIVETAKTASPKFLSEEHWHGRHSEKELAEALEHYRCAYAQEQIFEKLALYDWMFGKDNPAFLRLSVCALHGRADAMNVLAQTRLAQAMAMQKSLEGLSHNNMVRKLSAFNTIAIMDDSFLDGIELDVRDEIVDSDENINIYIPIWFDVDKAFGLNVASSDDYISMYVNWAPDTGVHTFITYCSNVRGVDDFTLDVVMTKQQESRLIHRLQAQCVKLYGKPLGTLYNEFFAE